MKLIKTIDKLAMKAFLGPMLASFFIVMFVLMMNFLWRYLDEIVGKGLSIGVILEMLLYAALNMISMGFPLATLFAAIMTMGNLGENYELLALKSAGISLPRIMFSLFVITMGMSVASFFVTNNLTPVTNRKMLAMIYDMRQQKQEIEFQEGMFFNGIDNVSIRVEKQNPETKLLSGIMIYNTETKGGRAGNMNVTVADSGYIRLSDDRNFLLTTLYKGENYSLTRDRNWYDANKLDRTAFDDNFRLTRTPGYSFNRTDASLWGSQSTTRNIIQLQADIDSLDSVVVRSTSRTYGPLLNTYLFDRDTMIVSSPAEARTKSAGFRGALLVDSIEMLPLTEKSRIYSAAERNAQNSRSVMTYDESMAKDNLNSLYNSQIEWHKKWSLPVAVIIFFLIGAPLGAIIRKGGLGMPIVISVAFFVFYYVLSIIGEKLAKEGSWPAVWGIWMPSLVLFPIAVYLTYKATNDSNLLNVEWYIIQYNKVKKWLKLKTGR